MSEPIDPAANPVTAPATYQTTWHNEADTEHFAAQLAQALQQLLPCTGGISISLQGDLGAGKTTLVRYLLRALGIDGRIKSPVTPSWRATKLRHLASGILIFIA